MENEVKIDEETEELRMGRTERRNGEGRKGYVL